VHHTALGQAWILSEDEVGDDLVMAVHDTFRTKLAPGFDRLLRLEV
jgi:hypothetical protein